MPAVPDPTPDSFSGPPRFSTPDAAPIDGGHRWSNDRFFHVVPRLPHPAEKQMTTMEGLHGFPPIAPARSRRFRARSQSRRSGGGGASVVSTFPADCTMPAQRLVPPDARGPGRCDHTPRRKVTSFSGPREDPPFAPARSRRFRARLPVPEIGRRRGQSRVVLFPAAMGFSPVFPSGGK